MCEQIFFSTAAIETWWWLPLLVAFVIAGVCSLAGLSGAFLLLPFQVSILGYTGLGVSATNHLYNTIAIQGGVYRLWSQGRLLWPLALLLISGTLPGVMLGVWIRMHWLHDLRIFKIFVGLVLLFIAVNLAWNTLRLLRRGGGNEDKGDWRIKEQHLDWRNISFVCNGLAYRCRTWGFLLLGLAVGMVGGVYGIGGGAIITPFIIVFYRIPIHALAAAALLTTLTTSAIGVAFFVIVAWFTQQPLGPDWALGGLLGLGGFAGILLGSRIQHLVREKWLRLLLLAVLFYTAINYLLPG